MTSDHYYQQALKGRGGSKTRNPRSYRRDDSYHNAVGNVSGFFAGLLGVTLALGGTAGFLFGGLAFSAGVSNEYQCNSGKLEGSSCDTDMNSGMMMLGLFLITASGGGIYIARSIFKDYNS